MTKNYSIVKVSLYDITRKPGCIQWQCIYDATVIMKPGIKYFNDTYYNTLKLFDGFDLKPYSWKENYWYEGIYKEIGIMVRGFKCYKYRNNITINKNYVIHKDFMKDFVKVI